MFALGAVIIGATLLAGWLTGNLEGWARGNDPEWIVPLVIGAWLIWAPIRKAIWGRSGSGRG